MRHSPACLTQTIVETVSDAVGMPIDDLPLLGNAIDPEALSTLVPADPACTVTVTFSYAGQRVLVHAGHTVYVRPITDDGLDVSSIPPY